MSRIKPQKKLFFSKTLEFLEHYLPEQALKSRNTVETHRDALTIFRRYVTDTLLSAHGSPNPCNKSVSGWN